MNFKEMVKVFEELNGTTKRLEKTKILSDFFSKLDSKTLSQAILMALGSVFPPYSEEETGIADKLLISAVSKVLGISKNLVQDEIRETGDIGLACEKLYKNKTQQTFFSKVLTINFVFESIRKLSTISGSNSQSKKISIILELLSSASPAEAKYISKLLQEHLRLGIADGTVRDAISQAFTINKDVIDRAYMLSNDLSLVGQVSKEKGEAGLLELNLVPGRPVKPMLAKLAEGIESSVGEMGEAICEIKYDGIRIQIHKHGDEISFFTRRLENVTNAVPEMIEVVKNGFPDEDFIIEGEMIATREGKPISFQNILQRVRRKYDIDKAIESVPLSLYLFDLLYYKIPILYEPLSFRRKKLEEIINLENEKINLSDKVDVTLENIYLAKDLFNKSIANNHEGIMIKDPKEPYIPGLRGKKMQKFKAEPETLDVVVVGGTYGLGKRSNFIGSYLLAIKDEDDNLKTIAHAGTGLSEDQLEQLTQLMEKYKIKDVGTKIYVEPKIILEIAYSEIVKSPEYETGYSLRFPVIKRIREDKGIADIDTVERLVSMF
ncbi:ATP-dependent DNA ligase [Methanobrevibacter curvatus]|uniref:DNA ligase n=1 Tax=Methanobrevibacter curvatus TaxID=49547 RepID=A0A166CHM2_9EURY|nr:ATP-dependent DNA ligase [Methanobrevibacter curvatus]KZX14427.1 DNA ligase B [Methanobrevibacter curvatus]